MTRRLFAIVVAIASTALSDTESAMAERARSALLAVPLSFEANQGQTDPNVKFLARGDGYALFLTTDSAVFKLRVSNADAASEAVIRMKLAGALSGKVKISGAGMLPGTANYFIGNDPKRWTRGAKTFKTVNYQQVYPGIDLIYYGTQRQLEYDFVVAPGADPNQIVLEFDGAKPRLTASGDLELTAVDGPPVRLRRPVVHQRNGAAKERVGASYRLAGNRLRLTIADYDRSRPLIIDPVLTYLTYLGGSGADQIGFTTYGGNPTQGVAADSFGNVYVTGSTTSIDFPLQTPFQTQNKATGNTGFVAMFNPASSQLIYSTYIGNSAPALTTRLLAIAVDSNGSAYVTGYTNGFDYPVTSGSYQTICGIFFQGASNCQGGAQSAVLTKLDPTGQTLVYSTFFGPSNEAAVAVAIDSQGQAYIAGNSGDQCASNDPINCFPSTPNAVLPGATFNTTLHPNNFNQGSAFVAVFDAAGAQLLYASLYGGTGARSGNQHATYGSGVAVDPSGNFYLAGTTSSNELPVTSGAFQTTYYGNPNPGYGTASRGFVAKFAPVASGAAPIYATYLGGTDSTAVSYQDVISGIAVDANGDAYLSGNAAYDFPATPGAYNSTPCPPNAGCYNRGFLGMLSPDGSALVWATFVGGVEPTLSSASTVSPPRLDSLGNVYISGTAGNNTQYPLVNPLQPANGFGGAFVTKFDPTGSTVYFSTVIYDPHTNGGIFSSGVDVDPQGNIYVAGYTGIAGLPVTAGAFQATNAGSYDGFIGAINPFVSASVGLVVAPPAALAGTQVTFTATLSGPAGSLTPTGTVSFLNSDGTLLGSSPLDTTGTGTFTTSTLMPGTYSVTAAYSGDNTFSPGSSPAQTLTIN